MDVCIFIWLGSTKDESLRTKLGTWAKAKIELGSLQKLFLIEQNNAKLKFMKEKHQKEIDLLQEESNERRKWAKEEHLYKIKIYELQQNKMK